MRKTIRACAATQPKELLKSAAKNHGLDTSQPPREITADSDRKHTEQQRQNETVQAIKSINTGRFIVGEEVFAWLETWGSNSPADAPQCK